METDNRYDGRHSPAALRVRLGVETLQPLARLRKAEQLLAAAAQNRGSQPVSSGQRRFGLDENTRKSIDALGLTQAERDQLSAARREEGRRRRQEEMDRFLAMSEKERRPSRRSGPPKWQSSSTREPRQPPRMDSPTKHPATTRMPAHREDREMAPAVEALGRPIGAYRPKSGDWTIRRRKNVPSERSTMPHWLRRSQRRTPFAQGRACRQFRCRGRGRCNDCHRSLAALE